MASRGGRVRIANTGIFQIRHDRTPSYAKHVVGRWVAEISRVIVEVTHADVVPAVVNEGAEEVHVWAGGEDFGWCRKVDGFGGGG